MANTNTTATATTVTVEITLRNARKKIEAFLSAELSDKKAAQKNNTTNSSLSKKLHVHLLQ